MCGRFTVTAQPTQILDDLGVAQTDLDFQPRYNVAPQQPVLAVLHRDDAGSRTRDVELQPEGLDPVALGPDVVMIPTPGHTRGHAVFLYRETFLFTGDHLAWSPHRGHLYAFRNACWYSWSEQIRSMERLLDYHFEWVLPGHGRPVQLPAAAMRASLEKCVAWMKAK